MKRSLTISILLFLLSGCAGPADWARPGADAADTAAALRQCRAAADSAVEPEERIDEDIEATEGTDWERSQIGGLARTELGAETRGRADRIVAACMRSQGFRPVR